MKLLAMFLFTLCVGALATSAKYQVSLDPVKRFTGKDANGKPFDSQIITQDGHMFYCDEKSNCVPLSLRTVKQANEMFRYELFAGDEQVPLGDDANSVSGWLRAFLSDPRKDFSKITAAERKAFESYVNETSVGVKSKPIVFVAAPTPPLSETMKIKCENGTQRFTDQIVTKDGNLYFCPEKGDGLVLSFQLIHEPDGDVYDLFVGKKRVPRDLGPDSVFTFVRDFYLDPNKDFSHLSKEERKAFESFRTQSKVEHNLKWLILASSDKKSVGRKEDLKPHAAAAGAPASGENHKTATPPKATPRFDGIPGFD